MLSEVMIKTFIEYHLDMSRRLWDSIDTITDEQFLADDAYSRGSIRNLMVHLFSTDHRWMTGVRDAQDVGHLNLEDFQTKAAAREAFEKIAKELEDYSSTLTEADLDSPNDKIAEPRWQILLHIINHGTDHRSTVLQHLNEYGAPTFDQDFVIWLWSRK